MPKELEYDCADGQCTWRWDANAYPVDRIELRIRNEDGSVDVTEVPNTGELVLPEDRQVEDILSTGEGGRTRKPRWRGPG